MTLKSPTNFEDSKSEFNSVFSDCIRIIDELNNAFLSASCNKLKDILSLSGVGILYSCWERLFRIGCSIGIRLAINSNKLFNCNSRFKKAAFISKEPFFKSFIDKTKSVSLDFSGTSFNSKGTMLRGLEDFLSKIAEFNSCSLDASDYVITFSNVNIEILGINADFLGFKDFKEFEKIRKGTLDELVGLRNDLAHGGTSKGPGEKKFIELINFTKLLLTDFQSCMDKWYLDLSELQ